MILDESKLTKEERAMLMQETHECVMAWAQSALYENEIVERTVEEIVVADFDDIEEVANDLMKLIELSEIYDGIPPLPSTYRAEEYARSRVKQYVLARIPPGVES